MMMKGNRTSITFKYYLLVILYIDLKKTNKQTCILFNFQGFKSHFNKELKTTGLQRQIFCCSAFLHF